MVRAFGAFGCFLLNTEVCTEDPQSHPRLACSWFNTTLLHHGYPCYLASCLPSQGLESISRICSHTFFNEVCSVGLRGLSMPTNYDFPHTLATRWRISIHLPPHLPRKGLIILPRIGATEWRELCGHSSVPLFLGFLTPLTPMTPTVIVHSLALVVSVLPWNNYIIA